MKNRCRLWSKVSICGLALVLAPYAHAQTAPTASSQAVPVEPPTLASQSVLQAVTVTATRLTTVGFNAPTPTMNLGTRQLQTLAEPNIAAALTQLPGFYGDTGTTTGNGGTSSGTNGLTELNLRGLGANRTLVLMDGQRIAPAFIDGTVDVSLIPQMLIKSVQIQTGGGSADWGSDAVAGVVNFITYKHFTGFQANVESGVTNYTDDQNDLVQAAWGTNALGDRFHIEAAGEYYYDKGVPAGAPGDNGGPDGRSWNVHPAIATRSIASTPAGQPEYTFITNTQYNTYSSYGLITSGPLKGTAFGPGGTTYPFQYGSPCFGSYCVGGDQTGDDFGSTSSYDSPLRRGTVYTRVSYDLTPSLELYATLSYAQVRTFDQPNAGFVQQGNLTMQCANPFVPLSVQSACAADGITNFNYGVANFVVPQNIQIQTDRSQPRYVIGLDDTNLRLLGKPWTLHAYMELGQTNERINISNMPLLANYLAAINDTVSNGRIVCASAAAKSGGCVPLDVFGLNPANPAAVTYIEPENGPFEDQYQEQEVGSASLSGAPLRDWTGPVSVAFGTSWRQEFFHTLADWYGAGVSAMSPVDSAYPAEPLLNTSGNNWYAGNFHDGQGIFNERSVFVEIGVPLFDNHPVGKLDADLAGRFTHYSTSGSVETWRLGGAWETPVHGLMLRLVRSEDIRAPNLQDLYEPASTLSDSGIVNNITGQTVTALVTTEGNPALKPELAQNLEGGIVFQPSWLRGLRLSFDYYRVDISRAIETLGNQEEVDLCQIDDNPAACKDVTFGAGGALTNSILLQPFNAATFKTDGFDIDLSYLADIGSLGMLSFTGRATHISSFTENTGIPGQPTIDFAGANDYVVDLPSTGAIDNGGVGIAPNWMGMLSETWTKRRLSLSFIQRFVSSGVIDPSYIQCNPGSCPAPTVQHPTINFNSISGAVYLDIGASYRIGSYGQVYMKIDNTLDTSPPPYGSYSLYDVLGRMYRLGFRMDIG